MNFVNDLSTYIVITFRDVYKRQKNGLNVLGEKNKKIESNLKKDYKYIYDIEKDTEGNIWVSTKEGIEEFDFDKYDTLYQRVADILSLIHI